MLFRLCVNRRVCLDGLVSALHRQSAVPADKRMTAVQMRELRSPWATDDRVEHTMDPLDRQSEVVSWTEDGFRISVDEGTTRIETRRSGMHALL